MRFTRHEMLQAMKAHVKLNTKKLYMSDGRAVQELVKIASMLYKASQSSRNATTEQEPSKGFDLTDAAIATKVFRAHLTLMTCTTRVSCLPSIRKISELKKSRQLASEITQRGAVLFDLLAKELENRVSLPLRACGTSSSRPCQ